MFVVERVPVPEWVARGDREALKSRFGDDVEWVFALPWVYGALTEPRANRPMLAAPRPGEDFWPGALAYWESLLQLLVYSFGWSRPDRGLRWWYDTGKPVADPKLALISEIWDGDGQLDWFAAWLWTTGAGEYLPMSIDLGDHSQVSPGHDWLVRVERDVAASGAPSPFNGSDSDPLHLAGHASGPFEPEVVGRVKWTPYANKTEAGRLVHTGSLTGWYASLKAVSEILGSSWQIDMESEAFGHIGRFRYSERTGLCYSCDHAVHLVGNSPR